MEKPFHRSISKGNRKYLEGIPSKVQNSILFPEPAPIRLKFGK